MSTQPSPAPLRDFTTSSFQRFLQERKLMASRCRACAALHLPPRGVCRRCHRAEMEWKELSGNGKLVAFTAIAVAPTAMVQEGFGRENPYCAGVVELVEGPRISARILSVDARRPESIRVGAPAAIEFLTGAGGAVRPLVVFRVG